jgi:hypothetical protein
MKSIHYVCDRCGLEAKSNNLPPKWGTVSLQLTGWHGEIFVPTDSPRSYCLDCSELIEDLFDSFKVSRSECGIVCQKGPDSEEKFACNRLSGHKGQHYSNSGGNLWKPVFSIPADSIGETEKSAGYGPAIQKALNEMVQDFSDIKSGLQVAESAIQAAVSYCASFAQGLDGPLYCVLPPSHPGMHRMEDGRGWLDSAREGLELSFPLGWKPTHCVSGGGKSTAGDILLCVLPHGHGGWHELKRRHPSCALQ